ncbi:protein peste-like isoform X1 [Diorhabda sublineata]|uniref:protein peste-like isoform X1 n=2 Tax=Diorhabda sublineata TaxID=1163346 RepID=UPI0024E0A44B|nr:protein peste-like isoform X1 [Diorhabda sublineata]
MNFFILSVIKHGRKAQKTYVMQSKKPFATILCVSGSCFTFVIVGILFITLSSYVYEAILNDQLILSPGSNAFNLWIKNPIPLTLTLHLFNWTNPEEIYTKGVKPRFEVLGPYVYDETKEKVDIVWNDNGTVTYKNLKKWWFNQEKSKGSSYDPFTSINPIALSAAYNIRNWHVFLKKPFAASLRAMTSNIWTTHSVHEVLFDGYEDPLLTLATKMSFFPKSLHMDKFGWFYGRNDSSDFEGIFNADTGVEGQIGELKSYRYSTHTGYYPDHCGAFEGSSAGDFFPRRLTKQSVIKLFNSDLCRYMELEFEKEVDVHGIVGFKYSAGDRFLDNGTKIPENKCFCDGDCMPSGALNVSNCRHGSPAFVSLPHFYKADPYYINSVEGLNPNENISDFFMIFEPNIGIPLHVSARLQLNLRLQEISGIGLFEDVPTVFFPVLYFEQQVVIPENMAFLIKMLINFQTICISIGIVCIISAVIIFTCGFCHIRNGHVFRRDKKMKYIQKEELPLNRQR